MKLSKQQLLHFLQQNYLILLIVVAGTLLRVWQLDTKAIFFSDAGKDLLVAKEAVTNGELPLLGISSSVPRFKQGPVSIWIEMITVAVFGVNTLAVSLVFALFSITAIIGVYEFVCIYIGRKQAITAAALLAFSPLAVAHARVPYHTTPLPFALVLYLFSLMLLWHKKKFGLFIASFAFCFLFQFELAMAALVLLIPFVMWQREIKVSIKVIAELLAGTVLGLLPQIIYDLTHNFQQVGVFVLWVGHKILEFLSFKGGGTTNIFSYLEAFSKYGGRIFSTDLHIINLVFLAIIIFGFYFSIKAFLKNKLPPAALIVHLALVVLTGSYFIHGSPSEAYFPPYLVLLPIHIAVTLFYIPKKIIYVVPVLVIGWSLLNSWAIYSHNFFVDNPQAFSYGTSTQTIRNILVFVSQKSQGTYELHTTENVEERFPNFFDNFSWIAHETGLPVPSAEGKDFYLAARSRLPSDYGSYFYRDFSTVRVYWDPQQAARHEDIQ